MNQKILFIINPNAGKSNIKNKLLDIIQTFNVNQYEVTTYITQCSKDAYQKVIDNHSLYDLIVCSGGDGTLNEVISACMDCNYKKNIAYIPSGTTNDFATSAQISKDPLTCANQIVEGTPISFDIGRSNNSYFAYIAAFGVFSDVSYTTPQSTKNILGHSAYILEGVKQWLNIPKYQIKIECDNQSIEGLFMYGMITNSLSVGGYHFFNNHEVTMNDGLFECLFIKSVNNPLDYQSILSAILSKNFTNCPHIITFKTKHLKITSDVEIAYTYDGEFGGKEKVCEIMNIHNAIHIIK